MLEIHYGTEHEAMRVFVTVLDQITIGANPTCNLRLTADGVAGFHCRVWQYEGRWVVTPAVPLFVNGFPIDQPAYVGFEDRLQVGSVVLLLKPSVVDPIEEKLIDGARDDLAGRAVYADWLEERGHSDRAEFLRLTVAAKELTPEDPQFGETTTRIQELAPGLDQTWRMRLASSEVEGCKELRREFTCTMTWDRLAPTDDPFVRSCGACKSQVHYCRTEPEAEHHARNNHCLVLDLAVDPHAFRPTTPRHAVEPPFAVDAPMGMYMPPSYSTPFQRACPQCSATVPAAFRFCPQCGTPS